MSLPSYRDPVELVVTLKYASVEEFEAAFAPCVGSETLFFWTRTVRPVGTHMRLEMQLRDGFPALIVQGHVRWSLGADLCPPGKVPGMGLWVVPKDEPSSRRIKAMVAKHGEGLWARPPGTWCWGVFTQRQPKAAQAVLEAGARAGGRAAGLHQDVDDAFATLLGAAPPEEVTQRSASPVAAALGATPPGPLGTAQSSPNALTIMDGPNGPTQVPFEALSAGSLLSSPPSWRATVTTPQLPKPPPAGRPVRAGPVSVIPTRSLDELALAGRAVTSPGLHLPTLGVPGPPTPTAAAPTGASAFPSTLPAPSWTQPEPLLISDAEADLMDAGALFGSIPDLSMAAPTAPAAPSSRASTSREKVLPVKAPAASAALVAPPAEKAPPTAATETSGWDRLPGWDLPAWETAVTPQGPSLPVLSGAVAPARESDHTWVAPAPPLAPVPQWTLGVGEAPAGEVPWSPGEGQAFANPPHGEILGLPTAAATPPAAAAPLDIPAAAPWAQSPDVSPTPPDAGWALPALMPWMAAAPVLVPAPVEEVSLRRDAMVMPALTPQAPVLSVSQSAGLPALHTPEEQGDASRARRAAVEEKAAVRVPIGMVFTLGVDAKLKTAAPLALETLFWPAGASTRRERKGTVAQDVVDAVPTEPPALPAAPPSLARPLRRATLDLGHSDLDPEETFPPAAAPAPVVTPSAATEPDVDSVFAGAPFARLPAPESSPPATELFAVSPAWAAITADTLLPAPLVPAPSAAVGSPLVESAAPAPVTSAEADAWEAGFATPAFTLRPPRGDGSPLNVRPPAAAAAPTADPAPLTAAVLQEATLDEASAAANRAAPTQATVTPGQAPVAQRGAGEGAAGNPQMLTLGLGISLPGGRLRQLVAAGTPLPTHWEKTVAGHKAHGGLELDLVEAPSDPTAQGRTVCKLALKAPTKTAGLEWHLELDVDEEAVLTVRAHPAGGAAVGEPLLCALEATTAAGLARVAAHAPAPVSGGGGLMRRLLGR